MRRATRSWNPEVSRREWGPGGFKGKGPPGRAGGHLFPLADVLKDRLTSGFAPLLVISSKSLKRSPCNKETSHHDANLRARRLTSIPRTIGAGHGDGIRVARS